MVEVNIDPLVQREFDFGDPRLNAQFARLLRHIEKHGPHSSGGGDVFVTVAANDTPEPYKSRADFQCNGTDDEEQWYDAINELPVAGGKVVGLMGTFDFGAPLDLDDAAVTVNANGLHLAGSGWGTVIKGGGTGGATIDSRDNHPRLLVSDLQLDGEGIAGTQGLVIGRGGGMARHVRFVNYPFGSGGCCNLQGSASVDALKSGVKDCVFDGADLGINVGNSVRHARIERCWFIMSGTALAIDLGSGTEAAHILGNHFLNAWVRLGDSSSNPTLRTDFKLNRLVAGADVTGRPAVLFHGDDHDCSYNTFRKDTSGNTFDECINLGSGNDNRVTGNDFFEAYSSANFTDGGTGTVTTAGNRG